MKTSFPLVPNAGAPLLLQFVCLLFDPYFKD